MPAAVLYPGDRHVGGDAGDVHAAVNTSDHRTAGGAAWPGGGLAAEVCRHSVGSGRLRLHGEHALSFIEPEGGWASSTMQSSALSEGVKTL